MRRLVAAVVIAVAAMFGGAQAATAPPDPIVGVWSYGGGTVSVRQTAAATFEGIVRSPIRFTQCTHFAGERMWTIVKTPQGYAGRQFSFGAGIGCRGRIWVSANWRLERGELRFWVATRSSVWPQRCGVETLCFRLARRSTAPAPSPTTRAQGVSFRFAVQGEPVSRAGLGSGYETTAAEGRGSVTAAGAATGTARVFHLQRTGSGELTELAVTASMQRSASKLVLGLSVRSSTLAGCAARAKGTLTLVTGAVDEAIVAVCGRSSRYRNGGGTSVRVSFARP